MIVSRALKDDLVKQVKSLEDDLREQAESVADVRARLCGEYERAFKLGRTAATWAAWRDERVTQAAAAWVLGTVFVRFCEDNALLAQPYIAGPSHDALLLAEEAQEEFFRTNPAETDRGWLLAAFAEIGRSRAGGLLFDEKHNPLYQIPISHDAAKSLIAFWQRRGKSGVLVHSFDSKDWDTRFLGDLYQDLSEAARKNFALLQTPQFVQEFILNRTLTPAIAEFGHDVVKMIDPTCGSGHFLLGAFHQLLKEWVRHAPNRDQRERVRLALGAVHGVDLNPFAVAIARFRLLIAALRAAGFTSLVDLEKHDLGNLNIAIGDALIRHPQRAITGIDKDEALADFQYAIEDRDNFPGILDEGRYHVVVGNPPYITVKDKKLNRLYRDLYDACAGTYALSVPFAQRFFQLARTGGADGRGSGYVGQITANSFTKREFGRKIIQQFFRDEIELTHVIDTSGAYIPGHSTPTVILIGRNKGYRKARIETIRTVMGVRGEPNTPEDPGRGIVWQAIVSQIDLPGSESNWVSVVDLEREQLGTHPWTLTGGGASDLVQIVEKAAQKMDSRVQKPIGRAIRAGADEAFIRPFRPTLRVIAAREALKPLMQGEVVRDWDSRPEQAIWYPYEEALSDGDLATELWPWRRSLEERRTFQGNMAAAGLQWWEYMQHTASAYRTPLSIAFAFVATHNHFVLDRGGKVFKQSAPVIKLPEGATEDEHLELLGVLNSSAACFWLKQVSHSKGNATASSGMPDQPWSWNWEFTGTKLQEFPLPGNLPLERGRELNALAQKLASVNPSIVVAEAVPTREALARARVEWHSARGQMIAAQEELDWEVYSLYGLLDEELTAPALSVPELNLGERAFDIVLARKMAAGELTTKWFSHHNAKPLLDLPDHWPAEYTEVVERRIAMIESDRNIALIERPECKRRWATEGFDAMQERALREWLLDRFEARELWFHHVDGMEQPRLLTTAQLADALRRDADVLSVARLYSGKDIEVVVSELVADEHVPYLAALRYKDSGLEKRADWEYVWDRQRTEDAAESEDTKKKIRDAIPVPPKYSSGDFLKTSYWSNRGKLDVPKERFISYPYAGRDGASSTKDGALLLGWAGFDHREQAQALATLIVEREQGDGWGADRLTPLLAGLREVLPWVRQWHGEFDATYGASPAEIYAGFLDQMASHLNLTDDDLARWRPPATGRGRRK
ncbi:BREX-2 system adenine-specific DNA-methyltransferase PglX [Acrocarpospora macrocephala]|uniref:site-specific DNA-methyltransferase (adenine-specific) n=1 Tax=Acrocarpospora macrocephala TaxID=150177 RepID=A0A5M3WL44_9ACTN|nr:BREX-2 system adenine-specific DNA-methyltransferase PglX [Acrocarpospora macrocephala]GES07633.1 DNA methylase [Acrocarpospora macrocephala]